ncbi:universal stress protein [Limosilactobacillus equigenerosi]|uniref:Universal stress protein n=1 Tax=Limosilactobacillus equigenerosi DSM 18793 = JCM 14505 TaxID=1423742 RepID=A0A0R1UVQ4_9LACO|nr:universal stress protein [Limosilactobacillus equigenerosi]KRL95058.1 universal stress protein UspA [Limosilactobacillus equigenerosi DSM 18793 = JCM 14505]
MEIKNYKRILVPVDGSEATESVVAQAISLARAYHAQLDLLNVIQVAQFSDGLVSSMSLSQDQTQTLVTTTTDQLNDLRQAALDAGVSDVDIHIRFGNPKQVIAHDFIEDHHNDLVVIGSTGLSAVERWIVGSVTSYVMKNAAADVVVVKK